MVVRHFTEFHLDDLLADLELHLTESTTTVHCPPHYSVLKDEIEYEKVDDDRFASPALGSGPFTRVTHHDVEIYDDLSNICNCDVAIVAFPDEEKNNILFGKPCRRAGAQASGRQLRGHRAQE